MIYEVHDLWPLSPIELGGMRRWHPFVFLMQIAENFACRHADCVVSVLPMAEDHVRAHGLADGSAFIHVPNGVDVSEWEGAPVPVPGLHSEALSRLRREGRFIVGYAGSHGVANALDSLVEAGRLLSDVPAAIVLVGQGPEKERLRRRAGDCNGRSVLFLPPVPKAAVPALIGGMDALYIGWQRKRIYRFGISPNKLMDYMMAARPVIHAVGAGNDLVAETACGSSVAPEDPKAIAAAIRELMTRSPAERAAMGLRGREYVLRYHNYGALADRFLLAMEAGRRHSRARSTMTAEAGSGSCE